MRPAVTSDCAELESRGPRPILATNCSRGQPRPSDSRPSGTKKPCSHSSCRVPPANREFGMTVFHKAVLILALALPAGFASAPTAAASTARHYDCSKPGNAKKAACKSAATASATATPARTTTTSTTTKTTARHYDCTKPGNAKKAACRTAASESPAGASPGAVKTTTQTTSTTTDCSKWYNKARAACRTTKSATPAQTTVTPAPKPTATPANRPTHAANDNSNPAGATAQCKDGTYSHAAHHGGACSHHGGVAKWLS